MAESGSSVTKIEIWDQKIELFFGWNLGEIDTWHALERTEAKNLDQLIHSISFSDDDGIQPSRQRQTDRRRGEERREGVIKVSRSCTSVAERSDSIFSLTQRVRLGCIIKYKSMYVKPRTKLCSWPGHAMPESIQLAMDDNLHALLTLTCRRSLQNLDARLVYK